MLSRMTTQDEVRRTHSRSCHITCSSTWLMALILGPWDVRPIWRIKGRVSDERCEWKLQRDRIRQVLIDWYVTSFDTSYVVIITFIFYFNVVVGLKFCCACNLIFTRSPKNPHAQKDGQRSLKVFFYNNCVVIFLYFILVVTGTSHEMLPSRLSQHWTSKSGTNRRPPTSR